MVERRISGSLLFIKGYKGYLKIGLGFAGIFHGFEGTQRVGVGGAGVEGDGGGECTGHFAFGGTGFRSGW